MRCLSRTVQNISLLLLTTVRGHGANLAKVPSTPICVPYSLHIPETVTSRPQKLIIAHRGASFHFPEHTLAAYRVALELGADFIEPDLVATSDGVLIAMHSTDLNVTTDVATVFADREPWFSPKANRSGYWSFNFTAAEIAKLTVKQRLPAARSTQYDGLFRIPTLREVLDTLNQWNIQDLPLTLPVGSPTAASGNLYATPLQLRQGGMYVELKDAAWLKNETDMDLVDLFFRDLQAYLDSWKTVMPCFKQMQYNEYKVPGLVIQSFDAEVLRKFSTKWDDTYGENSRGTVQLPKPPLILLANRRKCWLEDFWNRIETDLKYFVSGIGCETFCLLGAKGDMFVKKASENDLALHPWTERPELENLSQGFDTIYEEIQHLFCKFGVGGIFTETIPITMLAAKVGCDEQFRKPENRTQVSCSNFILMKFSLILVTFTIGSLLTAATVRAVRSRRSLLRSVGGRRWNLLHQESDDLEKQSIGNLSGNPYESPTKIEPRVVESRLVARDKLRQRLKAGRPSTPGR